MVSSKTEHNKPKSEKSLRDKVASSFPEMDNVSVGSFLSDLSELVSTFTSLKEPQLRKRPKSEDKNKTEYSMSFYESISFKDKLIKRLKHVSEQGRRLLEKIK